MAGDFGVKQVAIPGVSNGVGELRDSIKDMTNLVFQQKNMRLQEEANDRANATTQASIANDNTRTGMAMYSLARDTMKENREFAAKTAGNYVLNTLYSSDKLGSAVDADSKRKEVLSNPLMAGLFDPTVVKEVSAETQRRAGDTIANYKTNFKEPDSKRLNDLKYITNFYRDPNNLKADADPEYVLATGLASAGTNVKVKNSVQDFSSKKKEDLQNDFKEVLNYEKFRLDKAATELGMQRDRASIGSIALSNQSMQQQIDEHKYQFDLRKTSAEQNRKYLKTLGVKDVDSMSDGQVTAGLEKQLTVRSNAVKEIRDIVDNKVKSSFWGDSTSPAQVSKFSELMINTDPIGYAKYLRSAIKDSSKYGVFTNDGQVSSNFAANVLNIPAKDINGNITNYQFKKSSDAFEFAENPDTSPANLLKLYKEGKFK